MVAGGLPLRRLLNPGARDLEKSFGKIAFEWFNFPLSYKENPIIGHTCGNCGFSLFFKMFQKSRATANVIQP